MAYGNPYGPTSAVQLGGQNPYFNLQNPYNSPWGTPGGFLSTPLGQVGANQQDADYYQRLISGYAGGLDPFSRFVQGQQGRVLSGLGQARLTNPNLSITQYAPGVVDYNSFLRQFRQLSPGDRGERWSTFAPRTRSMGY